MARSTPLVLLAIIAFAGFSVSVQAGKPGKWRMMGCKDASKGDKAVYGSCIKCTAGLKTWQDYSCWGFCAASANNVDDMNACSQCIHTSYKNKIETGAYGCGQCIKNAGGDKDLVSACNMCVTSKMPDYYCAQSLIRSGTKSQKMVRLSCLLKAGQDNLKMEKCLAA